MWLKEEDLEKLKLDIYLHGLCHEWVKDNYKENDKAIIISEFNEDFGVTTLIHCCILRDNKFIDVRGETDDINEILEPFDYFDYEMFSYNDLETFLEMINILINS